MKLLTRGKEAFTFLIGKRERELLVQLLNRYPVLPATYHTEAFGGKPLIDPELLKDALAEQQKENKAHLGQWLAAPDRFHPDGMGFRFDLKPADLEWLLQLLNDIRVGSWVALGEPEEDNPLSLPEITDENVKLFWAMEMAALFQHALLEAWKAPEPPS